MVLEAEADSIADLLGEHAPALNEEGVFQDPETERVIKISLPNRGLRVTGPIPGSIGCCEMLTIIGLSNTKLGGHIPASMSLISHLDTLELSHCRLMGAGHGSAIPESFSKVGAYSRAPAVVSRGGEGSGGEGSGRRSSRRTPQRAAVAHAQYGYMATQKHDHRPLLCSTTQLTKMKQFILDHNVITARLPPKCFGGSGIGLQHTSPPPFRRFAVPPFHRSIDLPLYRPTTPLLHHRFTNPPPLHHITPTVPYRSVPSPTQVGMTMLVHLDMSSNKITGAVPRLGSLKSLVTLNLSNNHLQTIEWKDVQALQRLKMMYLSYNRFRCDVDLEVLGKMQGLLLMHLEGCFWGNISEKQARKVSASEVYMHVLSTRL